MIFSGHMDPNIKDEDAIPDADAAAESYIDMVPQVPKTGTREKLIWV